jgi:mannose-6-phosphate isomerase-like protein (cupin superfamily)
MRQNHDSEDIWFLNSWVTVRRAHAEGPDGVSILEHRAPFGDTPPTHMHHDEDEVFHLLEGEVEFDLGGRRRRIGPGETVVAPRTVAHCFRVLSPEGARFLTLVVGGQFESFVREIGRPATARSLPSPSMPSPDAVDMLARIAAANRIAILGPPMAA